MWPSDAPFQAGDEVQLTNLSKAHLNGARGVAVVYDAERGRVSVRLGDGGPPLAVRPANLVKAAPLAAEEEGGATDDEAEHAAWLAALPQMTATQLNPEGQYLEWIKSKSIALDAWQVEVARNTTCPRGRPGHDAER